MRSRKNKKTEAHVDHHRWIVSYADFITLLFAFFVVMYAISSVNISKYKTLSNAMKSVFNTKQKGNSSNPRDSQAEGPENKISKGTFQDGLDDLNKSLADLESSDFKINRQDGWIEMNAKGGSLFEAGTSDLKPEALIKLMQLAEKIKSLPYPVIVEGYTDNSPIETPQYPSNWELSASRAASVARVLNSYGVATERLIVTGYGEQYPIADNATEMGKSQNRRVNIIVAKSRSVDRLANPVIGQAPSVILSDPLAHEPKVPKPLPDDSKAAKPIPIVPQGAHAPHAPQAPAPKTKSTDKKE